VSAMANSPSVATSRGTSARQAARVAWTLVGLVLAVTAVALWVGREVRTEFQNSFAIVPGYRRTYPQAVRRLVVEVDSGSVTIDRGAGSTTLVDTIGTKSSLTPTDDEHLIGSTLYVRSGCGPSFDSPGYCSRDYRVRVPGDVSVTVSVNTGNVFVTGLHGSVKATVGAGNISVTRVAGSVDATTQSGTIVVRREDGSVDASARTGEVLLSDVRGSVNVQCENGTVAISGASTSVHVTDSTGSVAASGITGSTFSATVGDGPIEVSFTAPPHEVDATTQTGNITVHVPYADVRYQTHLKSATGRVVTGIPTDPSSTRVIRALTGNGDVILGIGVAPTPPGSPKAPAAP
jgi:Putative adhesin